MATKKTKTDDLKDEIKANASKVWLAGLGALATAEEEGGKLFRGLVKKGEQYEKKGKSQLDRLKDQVETLARLMNKGGWRWTYGGNPAGRDAGPEAAAEVRRLRETYKFTPTLGGLPNSYQRGEGWFDQKVMRDKFPDAIAHTVATHDHHIKIMHESRSSTNLLRRYSETRRPHPLPDQDVVAAIRQERELLADIRDLSDFVIDTSEHTVHTLRDAIKDRFSEKGSAKELNVTISSFGFRNGLPRGLDMLFDVRFLPNPHFVPELRSFTEGQGGRMRERRAHSCDSADDHRHDQGRGDTLLFQHQLAEYRCAQHEEETSTKAQ